VGKVLTCLVIPFLTGFSLGVVLCLGFYFTDMGGIRTVAAAAAAGGDLILQLFRFATAFGIMSVVTHFGFALVAD
jgi:hypothetical protein